ncbi:MAG: pyridoxal-phosphate dependent enzyme [Boseongicola sp.]|nr:MAG: pyridoxal-phosphate dependent enzyme [Boseongicola sp.]
MLPPTSDEIAAAGDRIQGHVHRTPVLESHGLIEGRMIELKLKNAQPTGSFKVRGAFNTLLNSKVPEAGVVAASGGNHGAAVAYAARKLGHRATVFVPELAGPSKIALIRNTGADLHVVSGHYAEALAQARAFEAENGAMQIHAYDAPKTLAGQGTVVREWEAQHLASSTVLIAVGGGGLIGGALSWLEGRRNVVAVEPERAPTLHAAIEAGKPVDVEVGGIAANALGAKRIGELCFGLAQEHDIQSVLVTDEAIADAQKLLWNVCRQWVEPAGATALAALTSGVYRPVTSGSVAVLVCGANPAPGPFD